MRCPLSIANAISAARQLRLAMAGRVFAKTCPQTSAGRSGPVTDAAQKQRNAALKLSQRECLIAQLKAMNPHDPRRGRLRREIYSLTCEALNG